MNKVSNRALIITSTDLSRSPFQVTTVGEALRQNAIPKSQPLPKPPPRTLCLSAASHHQRSRKMMVMLYSEVNANIHHDSSVSFPITRFWPAHTLMDIACYDYASVSHRFPIAREYGLGSCITFTASIDPTSLTLMLTVNSEMVHNGWRRELRSRSRMHVGAVVEYPLFQS